MTSEETTTEVVGNTDHNSKRGRSWFLTLNNWTKEEYAFAIAVPALRKIVAKEVGDKEGTPHLHMVYVFKNSRRFAAIKKMFPRANIDLMRGKWSDMEYLIKDGDVFIEDNAKQGQRTDIHKFVKDAKIESEDTIIQEHPGAWCKYQRAYQRLREKKEKADSRAFRKLSVTLHWGKTGTGKTRTAYDEGAFMWSPSNPEWWDGYEGENILLIDEFYGQMRPERLLHILDGYQLRLPIKGGFTYARWTKVYITSNVNWDKWYQNVPEDVTRALERRIHKSIKF